MPGPRVVLGRQFFRTAARLGASERVALTATLESLDADWPELPKPSDVADILAPAVTCWRRRIGASAWWLFFVVREDHVTAVAVAIPP